MTLQFKTEQSDRDRLSDMIVAAMETANAGRAREIVAEYRDTFPVEIESIRTEVLRDYGIRI